MLGPIKQAYRRAGLSYERSEADYVKFRLNYTHKDWMVPLFGAALNAVDR